MARGSLLDSLSKSARAALPFFEAAANTNLTSSQIISQAKAAGFSFRNQTGFDIIAQLRDNQSASQYIRSVSNSTLLNPSKFSKPLSGLLRNYSYRVEITGTNVTGETVNRKIVTVSTDKVLTKDQIIEYATQTVAGSNNYDGLSVDNATVVDALNRDLLE